MAGTRDRVNVEADQRVDLGDWRALQENTRTALKMGLRALIFGIDSPPTGRNRAKAVQGHWDISTASTEVTVTKSRAWAGEVLSDGVTYETGIVAGEDGDASQTLDLSGQPANTYYLYVRVSFDPGTPGSRVFWDAGASDEQVQSIDTRDIAGWKLVYDTSATAPDERYVKVGHVVWDGAAFTSSHYTFTSLYEGNLTDGAESANAWGGGANDRDTDRATYGIRSLMGFADAVRRQLKDIIGGPNGWYDAIPQTAVVSPGNDVDLTYTRDHIDTVTDPHSASPTWTGTTTAANATISGTVTIGVSGDLDCNGTADFDQEVTFQDNIEMQGSGINKLIRMTDIGDGSEDGETSTRTYGVASFFPLTAHWDDANWTTGGDMSYMQATGAAGRIAILPLNTYYNDAALAADGAFLHTLTLFGTDAASGTGSTATITIVLQKRQTVTASWTDVETWTVDDGDFGSTSVPSTASLSLAALSDANRKMNTNYLWRLRVAFADAGGGDSARLYCVSLATKHKYISY